jgi:hypothetical protein
MQLTLNHSHDDTEEGFVRREETSSSSECVTLHEALEGMLGKHFNDSSTLVCGFRVPLHVSCSVLKDLVKLVGSQLIR